MISIVIPIDRQADQLAGCLRALNQQSIPRHEYEILVVGDPDARSLAEVASAAGAAYVSCSGGAAEARNAGVSAARGRIICFTDVDCIPSSTWLETITGPFQEPTVAGVKGTYATHQGELLARFVQQEYEDKYDRLRTQSQIDFIDTYSAAYQREILLANEGFDTRFPQLDDQELSFRLAARGYRLLFAPGATVLHKHVTQARDYFSGKFWIGFWKAQVVRRFPQRGWRDSHTPQVAKVQIMLVGLMIASSMIMALSLLPLPIPPRPIATVLLLATLLNLLSMAPFLGKLWRRDRQVLTVAPGLLLLRALALLFGYGWGLLRPQPGISGEQRTIGGITYVCKRGIDILGSLIGLAFTAIVALVISVAIKLDSPGPVVFKQLRVGQGGKLFTIYKFRSMRREAEAELPDLLDFDSLSEPAYKLVDDPRITNVGRILRRWSLDELPQFWNVLKGDMSLIGPRPEVDQLVARYNDWHRQRLAVKPGMSGPMQVHGRGDLSLDERVKLELDYIENYSLWQDIAFIVKTFPAVVRGNGAR